MGAFTYVFYQDTNTGFFYAYSSDQNTWTVVSINSLNGIPVVTLGAVQCASGSQYVRILYANVSAACNNFQRRIEGSFIATGIPTATGKLSFSVAQFFKENVTCGTGSILLTPLYAIDNYELVSYLNAGTTCSNSVMIVDQGDNHLASYSLGGCLSASGAAAADTNRGLMTWVFASSNQGGGTYNLIESVFTNNPPSFSTPIVFSGSTQPPSVSLSINGNDAYAVLVTSSWQAIKYSSASNSISVVATATETPTSAMSSCYSSTYNMFTVVQTSQTSPPQYLQFFNFYISNSSFNATPTNFWQDSLSSTTTGTGCGIGSNAGIFVPYTINTSPPTLKWAGWNSIQAVIAITTVTIVKVISLPDASTNVTLAIVNQMALFAAKLLFVLAFLIAGEKLVHEIGRGNPPAMAYILVFIGVVGAASVFILDTWIGVLAIVFALLGFRLARGGEASE